MSIDTSSLRGLGTFYVEFQLVDGSAADGDANSRVTVSDFDLKGGTLGAILPPTIGNVTGSLAGALTLVDGPAASGGLADFAQAFTVTDAASELSFTLDLAATGVDQPAPDLFAFLILDSSLFPIPTDGPVGVEFVSAEFTTTMPTPMGFSSTAPPLTAVVTSIPEPSSWVLLAAGVAGLAAYPAAIRGRRPWPITG